MAYMYLAFFEHIKLGDLAKFGGKNSSLGEMFQALQAHGIRVPDGFALTADAYRHHITANNLETPLAALLKQVARLDQRDLSALHNLGQQLRLLIVQAPLPQDLTDEIAQAYAELSRRYDVDACDVAVRSSATAEDLPNASFAGQQDSFLHIQGLDTLVTACRACMASLFNDRALIYRRDTGFDAVEVALSVGIQKMVRSDLACSGVLFSLEPETGFKDIVSVASTYGLGEMIVQGEVTPDEFFVHKKLLQEGYAAIIKKSLGAKDKKLVYQEAQESAHKTGRAQYGVGAERTGTLLAIVEDLRNPPHINLVVKNVELSERDTFSLSDAEVLELAHYAITIEEYYSQLHGHWCPMDIEWAKDGIDGKLYIVQARPETIHAREQALSITSYTLQAPVTSDKVLVTGQSIGSGIVSGVARLITSIKDIHDVNGVTTFNDGDIIVTDMTDPDWVPLMKRAGGIVTNRGGRTCHAAIVSRELGLSAVIGTGNATDLVHDGAEITLDCSQGVNGFVYQGRIEFTKSTVPLAEIPKAPVSVLVNIGDPDSALKASFLPVDGVGLARLEFIISAIIKIHPMAIVRPDLVIDKQVMDAIKARAVGYADLQSYYVETLAQAVGLIAGAFYPRPVVVRLTDFKTNEYRELLGGSFFEHQEENPMLGFRGASRYCSNAYAPAFALECAAVKRARAVMGLKNIKIMVPFVRTVSEAKRVLEILAAHGLQPGQDGLEIFMMVEIPSNVILIEQFAQLFDGFSIGSNDLTQLTLGVDRDSGMLAQLFDERDPAVMALCQQAITGAHKAKKYIGICGQAPSDHQDFAQFLIEQGIDSLSLNGDSVIPFLMNNSMNS